MGKIAEQANIKKLDEAMNTSGRKKYLRQIYSNVLRVLQLKVQQLDLMFELIRTVAHNEVKKEADRLGLKLTIDNYEHLLVRYIPWKISAEKANPHARRRAFMSEHDCYALQGKLNLPKLFGQLKALQVSLQAIEEEDPDEERLNETADA
jgi:hypothetical protein